ncbi:MAG: alpha/beta hydrolase [Actinomycetota bacterium]
MPRSRLLVSLVSAALIAVACGDDGADDAATPTTADTSVTSTTAASATTTTTTTTTTTEPPAAEPGADPAEVRLTTIEVGEFVFDARVAGPDDGELVFLLHGFPSTSDQWRLEIPVLGEAGYRVVAPDQRGYSAGARPPDVADYRIELIADDVAAMADVLGVDRFHVVGHDFGGAAVWSIADRHADRLLSVTAISTPHPAALVASVADPDSDQADRSSYVDTFVREGSELIFLANDAQTLKALYAGQGLSEEEMEPQLAVLNDADAMIAALNWYRASFNESGFQVGPSTVPTMFIWSTGDDFLGPDPARATGDFVTGGYRFEIIADVDHWVPERAAGIVNPLLLDFLADPGAIAPGESMTTEHPAP